MAFSDPQSVTIGADTSSLPRIGSGVGVGSFKSNDGNVVLSVASTYGKRTRQTARLQRDFLSPDPFVPSTNVKLSSTAYIVVDSPNGAISVSDLKELVLGLTTWLTESSGANITKLLGGEN